jgi:virginiamycin B lyase
MDINTAGAKKLAIYGDWLATGAGAVWITQQNAIARIDPSSNRIVATIRVPACEATDFGFNAVWTATCGPRRGLTRIDAKTNRVTGSLRLAVAVPDGEGSIAAGLGSVWVVTDGAHCSGCTVTRVTPSPRLKIRARIRVRTGSAAVRVGEGAVWVTNPDHNVVQKISAAKNRVVATTKVGFAPRFFAVGEHGVWTLNQVDGTVTHVNPATTKVVATVHADVVGRGGDLTAGGGWVWARGSSVLLVQIDPRTDKVVRRYGPPSGSGAVIVAFGAVWVSAHDISTTWRLPLPPH